VANNEKRQPKSASAAARQPSVANENSASLSGALVAKTKSAVAAVGSTRQSSAKALWRSLSGSWQLQAYRKAWRIWQNGESENHQQRRAASKAPRCAMSENNAAWRGDKSGGIGSVSAAWLNGGVRKCRENDGAHRRRKSSANGEESGENNSGILAGNESAAESNITAAVSVKAWHANENQWQYQRK
jgi:hypothetical protein